MASTHDESGSAQTTDSFRRATAATEQLQASSAGGAFSEPPLGERPRAVSVTRGPVGKGAPEISGYVVTGKLGEGGMGTVWRAVQLSTHREVALKVLNTRLLPSIRSRHRFEREIAVSARLDHPCIARVFDAGGDEWVMYFAMELIDGDPLDKYVEREQLSSRQILELMRDVCRAVQHAHEHAVIHRDLKPSNILVTADGQPRVLDFGLAKITDDSGHSLALTREGVVSGTPAYMSPEQASGQTDLIDTRSDVYALGVILYRLLTGQHPHDLTGNDVAILRRISDTDAARPSVISPRIDRELEALLLKCLARDRAIRYGSAGELARDIDNYLAGNPLLARPITLGYVLRKRIVKHRVPVAAACAAIVALLSVAIVSYFNVVDARDDAEHRLADSLLAQGDSLLTQGRYLDATEPYTQSYEILKRLKEPTTPAELALWELYDKSPPPLMSFQIEGQPGGPLVAMADGRHAVAIAGKSIQMIDLPWGRSQRLFEGQRELSCLTLSADEHTVAAVAGATDIVIVPVGDGKASTHESVDQSPIVALQFRPRAPGLVAVHESGAVYTLDMRERQPPDLLTCQPTGWECATLAVDGKAIVGRDSERRSLSIDLTSGAVSPCNYAAFPSKGVAAWSLGEQCAIAIGDRVRIHDVQSNTNLADLIGPNHTITCVASRPNGHYVAAGCTDGRLYIWKRVDSQWNERAKLVHVVQAQDAPITDIAFVPGVPVVLTSGKTGYQVWTLEETTDGCSFCPVGVDRGTLSPDGRFVMAINRGSQKPSLWDMTTGQMLREIPIASEQVGAVAILPDNRSILTGSSDGTLTLWDTLTATVIKSWQGHSRPVTCIQFNSDGSQMVSGGGDGFAHVWNTNDWTLTRSLPHADRGVLSCVLVNGTDTIVTSCDNGLVYVWHGTASEPRVLPRQHEASKVYLASSASGRYLASAGMGQDHQVVVWDTRSWSPLVTYQHDVPCTAVAFSSNERQVASGDMWADVKQCDIRTGRVLRKLHLDASWIHDLRFDQADTTLEVVGTERFSRWDLALPKLMASSATASLPVGARERAAWFGRRSIYPWMADLLKDMADAGQPVSFTERIHGVAMRRMERRDDIAQILKPSNPATDNEQLYADLMRMRFVP